MELDDHARGDVMSGVMTGEVNGSVGAAEVGEDINNETAGSNISDGDGDDYIDDTLQHLTGDLIKEDDSGAWGIGMWGVWEITSSTPHFDLQKGGVFRLAPIML